MSIDPTKLPYAPRRKPSQRPDKPLPAPPPDEDVAATSAFERAQAFTSPPSPPRTPSLSSDALPRRTTSRQVSAASGGAAASASPSVTSPVTSPNPAPAADAASTLPPPPPPGSSGFGEGVAETQWAAKTSAAHLHPFVSNLPAPGQIPNTLTPLRAHYLKKTLVNLQMSHELNLITDPVLGANALGLLGDPFVLPDSAKKEAMARVSEIARAEGRIGDLPFMRFLFHQFLLPFPFLSTAPPTFWSAKVQPFLSSFLATTGASAHATMSKEEREASEALMTKDERKEVEERNKLWAKVEKHTALMVAVGIKIAGGEEVVRIGQADLRRLEDQQEARRKKWAETRAREVESGGGMTFEVNVVGVRVVTEKGRVRNKSHDEFIVRTRRSGLHDVHVSRRYGDFKRLADELRLAFPDYQLPLPPPKDKSVAAAPPPPSQTQYSYYNPLRVIYGSNPPSGSNSPAPGTPPESQRPPASASTASTFDSPASPISPTTPLAREKNRLTLRAYLQTILAIPFVLNSPILRSFLLSSPTQLTPAEAADCQRRLEGDAVREEGRRRFREEAEKRIEALREGLLKFKGEVLSKEGGLKKVFEVVRRVEKVEDLPEAEASVLEWGRISLAATIFQLFVASDTASDTLAALKRIHGLMPYFVLKGILRISNPMAMIRGVLDLFLARPFGGQSLIQRMFSASLTDDVRMIAEDIDALSERIEDPVLCQKVEQYAMAPFEIQEIFRKDAANEGLDLLTVVLRSPDPPSLSRPQFQRVARASRAYKAYKVAQEDLEDSDDDLGPEDEEAWLFEDLNILLRLWLRRREKEQLLALIFEGVTADLLKDIITIFYTPLAQVYKAASIADSLSDMQSFINDMIRTVEQVEELSQEDPQRTVQTFIDLVQRHEQSFYTFVHNVHSKGQGLFDSLMGWIELFLSYARSGLPQAVDLEFMLPAGGPEREKIMREVDAVAQYHYRLKVAHEEKIRRRFRREAAGEEEAALLDSVMASLSLGDTVLAEGGEMEDEESEEEDDGDDGMEESETSSIRSVEPGAIRVRGQAQLDGSGAGVSPRLGLTGSPMLRPQDGGSPRVGSSTSPGLSPVPPFSEKDRRGSSASNRSSLDKIRNTLRRSPDHDKEKDKEREGESAGVRAGAVAAGGVVGGAEEPQWGGKHKKKHNVHPLHLQHHPPPPHGPHPHSHHHVQHPQHPQTSPQPPLPPPAPHRTTPRTRKNRKDKKVQEMMEHPETKAIAELRPLFVEMIRPLLTVKPIPK